MLNITLLRDAKGYHISNSLSQAITGYIDVDNNKAREIINSGADLTFKTVGGHAVNIDYKHIEKVIENNIKINMLVDNQPIIFIKHEENGIKISNLSTAGYKRKYEISLYEILRQEILGKQKVESAKYCFIENGNGIELTEKHVREYSGLQLHEVHLRMKPSEYLRECNHKGIYIYRIRYGVIMTDVSNLEELLS